jgi:mono/diheme cytochrome c family protein
MKARQVLPFGALLFVLCVAGADGRQPVNQPINHSQFPPSYVPSGEVMYRQYCAACHGVDAKGNGPAAPTLRVQPPDLTTLAKRNRGKFPRAYVTQVLRFGPGTSSHGSAEMPTWGPIFEYMDKNNERAVNQRIKNLCDYLASLQER